MFLRPEETRIEPCVASQSVNPHCHGPQVATLKSTVRQQPGQILPTMTQHDFRVHHISEETNHAVQYTKYRDTLMVLINAGHGWQGDDLEATIEAARISSTDTSRNRSRDDRKDA